MKSKLRGGLLVSFLFFAIAVVAHADTTGAAACGPGFPDAMCNAPGGGPATINVTGGFSSSGILVTLTSISGLTTTNPEVLEDLNPSAPEQWVFAFSGGTWTVTDATDGDFSLAGTYTVSGTGTDSVTLALVPTSVSLVAGEGTGLTFTKSLIGKGDSGTATIDYAGDPDVTGVSVSSTFNVPTIPTSMPEPSTLGFLATGLLGLLPVVRRRIGGRV
jgi:hypothetical protein